MKYITCIAAILLHQMNNAISKSLLQKLADFDNN